MRKMQILMSLEYTIEYPCAVRRRYSEQRLRELARTNVLVSRVVSASLATESAPVAESVAFTSRYADELEQVESIAPFCRRCPAHIEHHLHLSEANEAIGCMGRARYPIDARFERFVTDRVQLLYDTQPPEEWPHLLRVLLDTESPFDGEATKALRAVTTEQGLRFMELRLPIQLARQAARLTSDHVFDLLAGFSASDEGASSYQRELPALALHDYAEFLHALFWLDVTEDEHARWSAQSQSFNDFLRWARAVQVAETLDVRLLLD
jgi:hypothetical protein